MSVDSGMMSSSMGNANGTANVNDANTPMAVTPDHSAVLSGIDSADDNVAFAFDNSPARPGSVSESVAGASGHRRRVCLRFEKTYAMKVQDDGPVLLD